MTLQLAIKRLAMMLALLPTVAPDNPIGEMAADLENAICNVFDAAARESRPTVDAIERVAEEIDATIAAAIAPRPWPCIHGYTHACRICHRDTSEPPEPPEGWGHPIAEEDK